MKLVKLPCYNMAFKVDEHGGIMVLSDLERETCPYCGAADCNFNCDSSQVEFDAASTQVIETVSSAEAIEQEVIARHKYNFALDAIESYTLALIVSMENGGFDTDSPKLQAMISEAVETAVDALGNHL